MCSKLPHLAGCIKLQEGSTQTANTAEKGNFKHTSDALQRALEKKTIFSVNQIKGKRAQKRLDRTCKNPKW